MVIAAERQPDQPCVEKGVGKCSGDVDGGAGEVELETVQEDGLQQFDGEGFEAGPGWDRY